MKCLILVKIYKMQKKKEFVIGSRDSNLALIQTNIVKNELEKQFPELIFTIKAMKTKGDKILSVGLSAIGDKGLFTKELETALLNNEIDFAVHSLKDMPTTLPKGLTIAAVSKREDPRDVIISNFKYSELVSGAKIGTSSLRRRSQLKRLRSDLNYIDIRGNLNTRLKKLDSGEYDAIILAYAGIKRLGLQDRIKEIFDTQVIIPAVGQGVLAIESRSEDKEILEILNSYNDKETEKVIIAERAFLKLLQGGCQVPIGANAVLKNELIAITGYISTLDGNRFYKHTCTMQDPVKAGIKLAETLLNEGADQILKEILSG